MAFVVSIVDTEAADSSHRVETEPDSTLGNLRGLICSMPLPSVERSNAITADSRRRAGRTPRQRRRRAQRTPPEVMP